MGKSVRQRTADRLFRKPGARALSNEQFYKMARRKMEATLAQIPSVPFDYQTPDLQHLYDYFLVNDFDYKGNAALIYSEAGKGVEVTAGFNLGALVCPGIVDLSVVLSLGVIKGAGTLMLLHRAMPQTWIKPEDRIKALDPTQSIKTIDKVVKPVCFMAMDGGFCEGNIGVSLAAGFGTASDAFNDEEGESKFPIPFLGINILGASLTGDVGIKSCHWIDNKPGWYFTAKHADLNEDLKKILLPRDRHYIKREAIKWLQYVNKNKNSIFISNTTDKDVFTESIKGMPKFRILNASSTELLDWLNSAKQSIMTWSGTPLSREMQQIVNKLGDYSAQLSAAINDGMKYLINENKRGGTALNDEEKKLNFVTLSRFRWEPAAKISIGNVPAKGTSGGGSSGSLSLSEDSDSDTTSPNTDDGGVSLMDLSALSAPFITFGAGASVDYKSVSTNYRYQTFSFSDINKDRKKKVCTQDVTITYSVLDISIAAQNAFDAVGGRDIDLSSIQVMGKKVGKAITKVLGFEIVRNIPWLTRGMHYKAVTTYWDYPDMRQLGEGTVKTHNGSGISFGLSIPFQTLKDLALHEGQYRSMNVNIRGKYDSSINKMIHHYARVLQISKPDFRDFLYDFKNIIKDVDFKDSIKDYEDVITTYGVVLLESSFRFEESVTINTERLRYNDGSMSATELDITTTGYDWVPFFENKTRPDIDGNNSDTAGVELESINIRLRLADNSAKAKSVFRLGIVLDQLGLALDFKNYKSMGNECIIDLYKHYFIKEDPSAQPPATQSQQLADVTNRFLGTPANREDSVPPVMLMPQPFTE